MKNVKLIQKIVKMMGNMCCSECKSDFTEESVEILREEKEFLVIKIACCKCKKKFGIAFLGLTDDTKKAMQLEPRDIFLLEEMESPIDVDDVLNAHDFIKNMDSDWSVVCLCI